MTLANEAGYLYVLSKKLTKINKILRSLSKDAHKHKTRHEKATSESDKLKHRTRHVRTAKEIEHLMKDHNRILRQLKHHQLAFTHQLHKEHKK